MFIYLGLDGRSVCGPVSLALWRSYEFGRTSSQQRKWRYRRRRPLILRSDARRGGHGHGHVLTESSRHERLAPRPALGHSTAGSATISDPADDALTTAATAAATAPQPHGSPTVLHRPRSPAAKEDVGSAATHQLCPPTAAAASTGPRGLAVAPTATVGSAPANTTHGTLAIRLRSSLKLQP